jgi:hypothetical protein
MKLRLALLPLLVCGAIDAQSSLNVASAGLTYIWVPPPPTAGFFFDLTLNTTVTFQGVNFPTYTPVGTSMQMQMYVTNPGTTTYVGNEGNPAVWTMVGSGSTLVPPAPTTAAVCFTSGVTLQPGTYGAAMFAQGANNIFANNGVGQVFSNADMTVTLGSTTYGGFAGSLANYVWIGTLFYGVGVVPHNCASKSTYGGGCNVVSGSFYQKWNNNPAAAAALNGRKLSLLFNGVNYTVVQGSVAYIAPTAAATALPTSNNGETAVNLPSPFSYPGGSTTQLVIATDGYIAPLSVQPFPGGNYSFMPYVQGFLDAVNPVWAVCWHNFNTTELGSGLIKTEQVGNLFVVTWDNVESLPGNNVTANPNPCTFQAQFDLTTGDVHYVYQSFTTIGGSQSYDDTIVGYSPGGPSPDGGPVDVTTLVSLTLPPIEVLPLKLVASAAAVLGTNIDFVTSQESSLGIGLNFLSVAAIPAPGINLAVLGAPGCFALIDPTVGVGNLISNLGGALPPMNVTLPIPLTPSLSGAVIYSQSLWLDAAANPFGATTSNGVSVTAGLFAL